MLVWSAQRLKPKLQLPLPYRTDIFDTTLGVLRGLQAAATAVAAASFRLLVGGPLPVGFFPSKCPIAIAARDT